MTLTGRCRCSAITYSAEGNPAYSALCHCADCRLSSGAPMVGWALYPRERVSITGSPVAHESSPGTIRQFCGICGTGLFYRNEAVFPGQIDIQSATLDNPEALAPQVRVQVAEALHWFAEFDRLPTFERYPG